MTNDFDNENTWSNVKTETLVSHQDLKNHELIRTLYKIDYQINKCCPRNRFRIAGKGGVPTMIKESPKKEHLCSVCDKVSHSKNALYYHLKSHNSDTFDH